jgi:CDP-diacylglycerol--serine O-phosphatidyltransferase
MKFLGVYDYTVILTYMSLFSAFLGMTLAHRGSFTGAIVCLLLSGLCDAFDGTVARSKKNRTEDEKAFGIQLDSLCDVVSFGVFPAYLCYCLGIQSAAGIVILGLYCVCAVIRLAFFNVQEGKRQQTEGGANKVYRGLPVTTMSMILPPVYLLRFLLPRKVFTILMHIVPAVVGFLFILDVPIRKPDMKKLFSKQ